MGRLVQHQAAAGANREHPTGGSRSRLLCKPGGARQNSRLTQTKQPPANPGRFTRDGKAVLWFDRATVWRLVDHATNSRRSMPWYGKRVGKSLLLVGDTGIYLMSNGLPAILHDGTLLKRDGDQRSIRLIAEAEGCDSSSEIEAWWPLHNIINEGSDFSIPIPVEEIRLVLRECHMALVIVAD